MDLQQVMHGANRWGAAPAARRNDYWKAGIWKGDKSGLELNGIGDSIDSPPPRSRIEVVTKTMFRPT